MYKPGQGTQLREMKESVAKTMKVFYKIILFIVYFQGKVHEQKKTKQTFRMRTIDVHIGVANA